MMAIHYSYFSRHFRELWSWINKYNIIKLIDEAPDFNPLILLIGPILFIY